MSYKGSSCKLICLSFFLVEEVVILVTRHRSQEVILPVSIFMLVCTQTVMRQARLSAIVYKTIWQYNDKAPIDFNQTEGLLGHHSIMQYDPAVLGIQKLQL